MIDSTGMETEKICCEKCKKMLAPSAFYTLKTGGKTEYCKKCLTMHVNAYKPETFTWILQKMDMPYIPTEWNSLRDKQFAKEPKKSTNHSVVVGKYFSKMRLTAWKEYGWNDSEELIKKAQEKREKEEVGDILLAKYKTGEIGQAQYLTLANSEQVYRDAMAMGPEIIDSLETVRTDGKVEIPDPTAQLTRDDKTYLIMKWGDSYTLAECIELEKDYNDMMNSFDIQDADTINTLKLLCKTTLKQNQMLDANDFEGYQKLSRVAETLRKTAKFTAAQNKEDKGNAMDSIGEFVALCEREEGFIPRYATDVPQDKIDLVLKDMNAYVKKLVTEDLGFGQQIEDALKRIQIQKEMQEAEEKDFLNMEVDEITNEDYEDFIEDIQRQKEKDGED